MREVASGLKPGRRAPDQLSAIDELLDDQALPPGTLDPRLVEHPVAGCETGFRSLGRPAI
jgi:hypothetical protein